MPLTKFGAHLPNSASRSQRCFKSPWKGWYTRKPSTRDDQKKRTTALKTTQKQHAKGMNHSTFFDRSDPVPVPISNSVPFLVPLHQSPFQFQFSSSSSSSSKQVRTSRLFWAIVSHKICQNFCYKCKALSVKIVVCRFFFWEGGVGSALQLHPSFLSSTAPQLERIDRSRWRFVKFSFQNLKRQSVKVPKFGTWIRNGVKITTFRPALAVE